ncbi:MAG: hypothetical protein CVV41_08160 [Candidatus Riflebacteria bacterium HGW-Riflebacteria-1]|nr:MAG: hypothetical protein CVV41_08160 [Candidatus Riflebacteria bacterium HGW-Riflebacteria-1]
MVITNQLPEIVVRDNYVFAAEAGLQVSGKISSAHRGNEDSLRLMAAKRAEKGLLNGFQGRTPSARFVGLDCGLCGRRQEFQEVSDG